MSHPQDHPALVALSQVLNELLQISRLTGMRVCADQLAHIAQAQIEMLREELQKDEGEP